jgi:predicted house-cleaning noncanonical NTP pyrophosphatase (MazG superfamily)
MLRPRDEFRSIGLKISVAAIAGGIAAMLFGWPSLAVAAVAVGVAFGIFAVARRGDQPQGSVPSLEDVSTPSKTRLKPIVKLREEIMRLITGHHESPVIAAMALDTQTEVDAIVVRSLEILEAKRKVQKLSSGVYRSRAVVTDLEEKLAGAADPGVRSSMESALTSRRQELRVLEDLELTQRRLDANLDEAESTLAELKSRLLQAVAETGRDSVSEELDPFSEMTSRLKRLSSTMEESIETVSNRNWD